MTINHSAGQTYVNESDEQGQVELAISMIMMIMMLISDLKVDQGHVELAISKMTMIMMIMM